MGLKGWCSVMVMVLNLSCAEEIHEKKLEVIPIEPPCGEHSSLPYLLSNSGKTFLSWVEEQKDGSTFFRYAEFQEGTWQKPYDIANGTDWFVNWADFPAFVENEGNFFSHILKKSAEDTYSYDIKMNLKPKGMDWQIGLPLHDDGTPTEHGFVTALPYHNASFFVTWLDGRNTVEKEGQRGPMSIRAAVVASDGTITNENLLDPRTCDCCQTGAAITANGPIVVYRDRSEDEVRDISIVRKLNGKWTAPKSVYHDNWKINGCPVNGPKAVALGNTLAVAWFTEAGKRPTVKLAFSDNGGNTFQEPISMGTSSVIGRVDAVLLDAQTVLVSYVEREGEKAYLKVVKATAEGRLSPPETITEINSSRQSGFPQMEHSGKSILFAWTEVSETMTQVKTVSVLTKSL